MLEISVGSILGVSLAIFAYVCGCCCSGWQYGCKYSGEYDIIFILKRNEKYRVLPNLTRLDNRTRALNKRAGYGPGTYDRLALSELHVGLTDANDSAPLVPSLTTHYTI